ncbi:MAG: YlmC/YmxH family sporulation protein [Peptococcaceae bacterium]|nr:YlmC/YmxH family sporulation protein [Peptococcaceae bacterium]
MLLSEFSGKEIINLRDGSRLGLVGDSDIRINSQGEIRALVTSSSSSSARPSGLDWIFGRSREREGPPLYIPWDSIKKIGQEVIIVDVSYYDRVENEYS